MFLYTQKLLDTLRSCRTLPCGANTTTHMDDTTINNPSGASGRPKTDNPKLSIISLRCTPAEAEHIKSLAASRQLSASEFCRRAVLGKRLPDPPRPVPAVNEDTALTLNRIAININQAVKRLHIGLTGANSDLAAELDDLLPLLLALATTIVGESPNQNDF